MPHSAVRPLVLVAAGGAVALGVAACGGSSGTTTAAVSSSPSTQPGQGQQPRIPGTSGLVAAISGTTLQVQSSSAQTAVTYSSSTRFTASTTVALSAVRAGECATVSGTDSSGTFTATSIRISQPVSGACTAAGFGGFGGMGGTGTRPSDAPGGGFGGGTPASGAAGFGGGTPPSGAAGGFGGGSFLTGTVTSVSSTGLVVDGTVRSRGTTSSAVSGTTTTVTAGSTTTITETAAATSASLKVGVCVTAIGTTGTTGAVTARTIAVSAPVDGACTTGFGGRPGAGQGGAGA